MHTILRAFFLTLALIALAACGGNDAPRGADPPVAEKPESPEDTPPDTGPRANHAPAKTPPGDPRSEAMEAAIRNSRYALCPGMDFVPLSRWPYLLVVERRGSETGSEPIYRTLAEAVARFEGILEESFPGAFRKKLETPLRVVVHVGPYDPDRKGRRSGKHNEPPETVTPGGCFYPPSRVVHVHRNEETGSKIGLDALLADLFYWMTIQRLAVERRWLHPHPWKPTPAELERFRAEEAERLEKRRTEQSKLDDWIDRIRRHESPRPASVWLDRGMAEYVRGLAKPTEKRVCRRGLRRLRFFHKGSRSFSLTELAMCRSVEEADLLYRIRYGRGRQDDLGRILLTAEAWSLVHFFLHEPSGRHRERFLAFVRKSAAGDSFGFETLCACFGFANEDGWTGIDESWKEHVGDLVKSSPDPGGEPDAVGIKPAPPVNAVVQKVNDVLKYVMLSVGTDDGVVKGERFVIRRDGRPVGEVQVDYLYPKACSASFVSIAPGMKIKVGDMASTRP